MRADRPFEPQEKLSVGIPLDQSLKKKHCLCRTRLAGSGFRVEGFVTMGPIINANSFANTWLDVSSAAKQSEKLKPQLPDASASGKL